MRGVVEYHQRLHGNAATQRALTAEAAVLPPRAIPEDNLSSVPANPVQRLMTSNQLIHGSGVTPHNDVALLGLSLHKHSTHYKALLNALDKYHAELDKTPPTQWTQLFELLNTVKQCCDEYFHRDKKPPAALNDWLIDLTNQVSEEKRKVSLITQPPHGKNWRQAIGGYGESGGLVGPVYTGGASLDPGLETTFSQATPLFKGPDLNPKEVVGAANVGELAVRHATKMPGIAYVEKYTLEPKKSSPKVKEFPSDGKGYVADRSLAASRYTHEEVSANVPLFTRKPCLADINQQQIGDCYLLAAIGAIVHTDPDFVYTMMRDNGGNPPSVTVRLYDPTKGGAARYIAIEKSVISHDRHSAGALWVPMLEKAYAALGVTYNTMNAPAVASASYLRLGSGGHAHDAFGILTGHRGTGKQIVKPGDGSAHFGSIKPWSPSELIKFQRQQLDKTVSKQFFVSQTDAAAGDDLAKKWLGFLQQHQAIASALAEARTIERIESLLNNPGLDPTVKAHLLPELRAIFPGKRGSGRYTPSQLDDFKRISDALIAKKYVAVQTDDEVAKQTEGSGHSAGEPKAKGLVGLHVYTVLSVRVDPNGRRFVRIRNPWGSYGRVYKEKGNGVLGVENDPAVLEKKQQSAEFDLELSDLGKRFKTISISA